MKTKLYRYLQFISESSKNDWTKEKCAEEALKYDTRNKLFKNNRSAYDFSSKNGWLDEFYGVKNTLPLGYWTKERCKEEALKYKYRKDFQVGSKCAYMRSYNNNWLDEICTHMIVNGNPNGYWTKEKCQEEALKYKSRSDFQRGSGSAYTKSSICGWMDEICSHMVVFGNKFKRCVYAIEFSDNHAYVGLTYNCENRFKNHVKDDIYNKGGVLNHVKITGITPKIKQLTDYIETNDASKLEEIWKKKYENDGWVMLNKIKCGGIGGNSKSIWTKEKCQEEALKYKNKKEFYKNSPACWLIAYRNNWLNDLYSHMIFKKRNNKGYWTKEKCQKEALKYKSRWEFEKNSPGAYGAARRNKWINEICLHMIKENKEVNMKIFNYISFINENLTTKKIPTYEECVNMCNTKDSPFYESKFEIRGYPISAFNYRLAQASDFKTPQSREMRGITFVFNKDGTLYKRYILLEKFFNLNQVPGSMYSDVSDYKIMQINNKEDGSIASFIELPNGEVVGKSKMGFDNEQSNGINRIYRTNPDIKKFVDWSLSEDYIAIFEFVSPSNRIVLRYDKEELILLRLRKDTGEHLNIKDYSDKIGSIRIAPFEDENSLDQLIKKSESETGREGWVITFENGQMIKIKTSEYMALHGLLTDDLYREHILINYILEDKIDDILGQIPEEQPEAHERINKMINIVRREITDKIVDIRKAYDFFLKMGGNKKEYAMKHLKDPNFHNVMALDKGVRLSKMTEEEIFKIYDTYEDYEASIKRCDIHELAKADIRNKTDRLLIAREWLKKRDPSLFFVDPEENDDNN